MGSREHKFSVGFPLQAHYMLFRFSDTIDFKWVVHVGTTWDLDGLGGLTWALVFFGLPMWAPHGIYMGQMGSREQKFYVGFPCRYITFHSEGFLT